MGSHLTDPWFWVLVVLGLVGWLIEQLPIRPESRFLQFYSRPAIAAGASGATLYALSPEAAVAAIAALFSLVATRVNGQRKQHVLPEKVKPRE